MDEDEGDLSVWTQRVPAKPASRSPSEAGHDEDPTSVRSSLSASPAPSVSANSSDAVEFVSPMVQKPDYEDTSEESDIGQAEPDTMDFDRDDSPVIIVSRPSSSSESEDNVALVTQQPGLSITLPALSEDDKEEYDFLPNHFDVKRVMYALGENALDRKFVVELASGEVDMVGSW